MMRSCRRTSGHTHRIELHQILLRFAECRAAVWCVPFFGAVIGFFNKLQTHQKNEGKPSTESSGHSQQTTVKFPAYHTGSLTSARHQWIHIVHGNLDHNPNPTLTRRASQHGYLCARRGVRGVVPGLWQGLRYPRIIHKESASTS